MSMMPNTTVSPAASRKSISPNCSPFRHCSRMRAPLTSSFHLAVAGVRVGVVAEDRAHGAVGHVPRRILLDHAQVVVLDRIVVGVEAEAAANGLEIGLLERLAQ